VKQLKSLDLTDEGRVKRVRGLAYTAHGSAANANRIVTAARAVFHNLLPDVYVYTDHYSKRNAGPSPGCGVSLVAQTTSGCALAAQATAPPNTPPDFESIGIAAANLLCEEIARVSDHRHGHSPLSLSPVISALTALSLSLSLSCSAVGCLPGP
jgi:RNA 3'-terminal phosphate cyclase-like protein